MEGAETLTFRHWLEQKGTIFCLYSGLYIHHGKGLSVIQESGNNLIAGILLWVRFFWSVLRKSTEELKASSSEEQVDNRLYFV